MPLSWILLILAVIGTIAFLMARSRAIAPSTGTHVACTAFQSIMA